MLDKKYAILKPDSEFLELLAGEIGCEWISFAASLSLNGEVLEELKRETFSQKERALLMLKKWVVREDATYGQLCWILKTIPLFQY